MALTRTSFHREYIFIVLVAVALGLDFIWPELGMVLAAAALLGALPTLWEAAVAMLRFRISIDTFNAVAIIISFATAQYRSAAFIVLMLAFARLLDDFTKARSRHALEELFKLKPATAFRERDGAVVEIPAASLATGDTVVIQAGGRVPVDGVVLFGESYVNESSVTGESQPVPKAVGDGVLSSSVNESGVLKIRATRVGADSTIERIIQLVREAEQNKSRAQKLADVFAMIFLPVVLTIGGVAYWVTGDLALTAALFLVACADDMAVAIPLAATAALGQAAKRGVVIKGGERIDALGRVETIVIDKTGTLTYGTFQVERVHLEPGVDPETFWRSVAIAEKYSEHPIAKALLREARANVDAIPDPEAYEIRKGAGVVARYRGREIAIGNEKMLDGNARAALAARPDGDGSSGTRVWVTINGKRAGHITIADVPRPEAKASMRRLREIGIKRIVMFTGDNADTARAVSRELGITEFHASMMPEDKLRKLEELLREGRVAMIGDGINDAPALARATVGITMGGAGTAVAAEAADVVILTDNLARIPEAILLCRRTTRVIRLDMAIWVATNIVGYGLVFVRFLGPSLAAFYNFATDFLPLINSARLFRNDTKRT